MYNLYLLYRNYQEKRFWEQYLESASNREEKQYAFMMLACTAIDGDHHKMNLMLEILLYSIFGAVVFFIGYY